MSSKSIKFIIAILTILFSSSSLAEVDEVSWPGKGKSSSLQIAGTPNDISGNAPCRTSIYLHSATRGFTMNRSGSIIGVTSLFDWTSTSVAGDLNIEVRVNDVAVFTNLTAVTTPFTGDTVVRGSQNSGIDTFVNGDLITCSIVFTGGLAGTINLYDVILEIAFD